MQNNNHFNDEMEIDVIDLIKDLLCKWKWLICGMAFGMILALGLTALKPSATVLSVEEQKAQVLERLSEADKNNVENLYQSVYVMNRRIDIYRAVLLSSKIDSLELDENDRVMKRIYLAVNSPIHGMNYVISETALEPNDYKELSVILYGDDTHTDETAQRVFLKCMTETERLDPVCYIGRSSEDELSYEVLVLTAISDSIEKVDAASEYLVEKLSNKSYQIGNQESPISIDEIDCQYSENESAIVTALYSTFDTFSNILYNAEDTLNSLQTNYISKLTGDSKTYYSLLNNEGISTIEPKKYKRNGFLGAILGLFVVCAWFVIKYVFDGNIKTAADLNWLLNGDKPHELKATTDHSIDVSETLIAEDIAIKLKQKDKKTLFVSADDAVRNLDSVQKTIKIIKDKFSGDVRVGDPCESSEDMKELSESDAVVMIVPLKQEKTNKIIQIEQLCRGYNSEVIGVIAL